MCVAGFVALGHWFFGLGIPVAKTLAFQNTKAPNHQRIMGWNSLTLSVSIYYIHKYTYIYIYTYKYINIYVCIPGSVERTTVQVPPFATRSAARGRLGWKPLKTPANPRKSTGNLTSWWVERTHWIEALVSTSIVLKQFNIIQYIDISCVPLKVLKPHRISR